MAGNGLGPGSRQNWHQGDHELAQHPKESFLEVSGVPHTVAAELHLAWFTYVPLNKCRWLASFDALKVRLVANDRFFVTLAIELVRFAHPTR